jgi:catechol 2,3-dioxygenase-like lactoylglutathione lyase family enzyme
MIDHIGLGCADIKASIAFYEAALAPLGCQKIVDHGDVVAFGVKFPQYWLGPGPATERIHIALMAGDRAAVDAFHAAGLAAGGRDNGAPGLREHYAPTYYAAYLFDPDGNNIEAVCHTPA